MTDDLIRSALPRFGRVPRGLLRDPHVPDRAVRLYGLLDDYAGAHDQPFPKRATIAASMGCSVDTVDRAIAALEAAGWLVRQPRWRDDGGQSSNLYLLAAEPDQGGAAEMRPPSRTGAQGGAAGVRPQEGEPHEGEPPSAPQGGRPRRRREAQDGDPAWEAFWQAYPRKTGKGAARRAWPVALDKTHGDAELIIAAARTYAGTITELRYAAHPSTWLNGERWTDDLAALRQRRHVEDPTRPVNWRRGMPECPDHAGQHRDRCPACASERLAGDR